MAKRVPKILAVAKDSSRRIVACWLWAFALAIGAWIPLVSDAQDRVALGGGLKRFSKDQWTVITDLPIDQEIESWPVLLDQALMAWCQKWGVDVSIAKTWPLTIHCIGDRKVFEQSGLLEGVPGFDDGFQQADRVFFFEQPSIYYRRHLLIHEATHWVMSHIFGGGGAPWFMEGMAEVEGTHRLDQGVLNLGIIPSDPQMVPHWGRFKRLSESIAAKGVPSMRRILGYTNDRQDRMDRYSWSWAACVFFRNHPLYATHLDTASKAPLDYSMKLSEKLLVDLKDRWDWVERDWKLFVDEFDFGYQPQANAIALEDWTKANVEPAASEIEMELDVAKGWQFAQIFLKAGHRVRIQVDGLYVVRTESQQVWESSPEGLTYQYFRHMPMGKTIGAFVSTDALKPLDVFGVGSQAEYEAPTDGWMLFRVNEPVGQRQDNSGKLNVRIAVGN